jgi:hypothetical protein
MERIDREFLSRSGRLNAMVARRATQLEARLAHATSIAQSQLRQNAILGSRVTPQIVMLNQGQAVNNQLASLVATSSARLNQLNSTMKRQFGIFAAPFMQRDNGLKLPANAFENNLQFARFAFTSSVANTVNSVAAQVQNQVSTLTSAVNNATRSPSTTGTSTTGNGSVGTVQTQSFNDLFTQAFSSINSAITGVDSTLAHDFASLTTAFNINATAFMTTLNTSPFGTFQPVSSFVAGNGITFTSFTPSTGGGATGGISIGTVATPTGTTGTTSTTGSTGGATGTISIGTIPTPGTTGTTTG